MTVSSDAKHGVRAEESLMIEEAASLDDAIERLYNGRRVLGDRRSVGGGDINISSVLTLDDGSHLFLKENRDDLMPMFAAEALGLAALADIADRSNAPPVPQAYAWGIDGRRSFLLMEKIVSGRLNSGSEFGRALAVLHREGRSDDCGFPTDNWIGSNNQPNRRLMSWHDFFAERRLGYQWRMARTKGFGRISDDKAMESLLNRLPELLPDIDDGRASLLHGDLWGGNWMADSTGRAWLIDPAVYYGHREADLAMTELFGGFPPGFRQSYEDEWPIEPGFTERRDLYNLYHILNHANLFGSSYWNSAVGIVKRYA